MKTRYIAQHTLDFFAVKNISLIKSAAPRHLVEEFAKNCELHRLIIGSEGEFRGEIVLCREAD